MKKTICSLLILCLTVGMFSGCTKKDDAEKSNTKINVNDYKADPNEKYKISWTCWLGSPVEENAPMIKYWNDKFNVDINVWNVEPSNYSETIGLKIASGEVPDVLWLSDVSAYYKYAKDGILAKITPELVEKCASHLYKNYMSIEPNAFKYRLVNDELYGIPGLAVYARRPLAYRGDWMEKLGVPQAPTTLDEFEKLMYKFSNDDPDGNGKKDTYGLSNAGVHAVYGAYGLVSGFWLKKGDGIEFANIQPEMKEAYKILNKWYVDGVLDPEFIMDEKQGSGSNMSKPFVTSRIGFTASGENWHYKPKFENSSEANDIEGDNVKELRKLNPTAADKLLLGRPIIGPDGKSGMEQGNFVGATNPTVGFGGQLSKEPGKLAKILEIIDTIGFTSRENLLTAENGIKGVHWDFNDKNQISYKDAKYEKYTERAKMGAHCVMTSLKSGEWSGIGNESYVQWEKSHGDYENGIKNELKTILASQNRYGAELDKLCAETAIAIITGDKPIEYFDEFVKTWKEIGGDKLTVEANEWYKSIK